MSKSKHHSARILISSQVSRLLTLGALYTGMYPRDLFSMAVDEYQRFYDHLSDDREVPDSCYRNKDGIMSDGISRHVTPEERAFVVKCAAYCKSGIREASDKIVLTWAENHQEIFNVEHLRLDWLPPMLQGADKINQQLFTRDN